MGSGIGKILPSGDVSESSGRQQSETRAQQSRGLRRITIRRSRDNARMAKQERKHYMSGRLKALKRTRSNIKQSLSADEHSTTQVNWLMVQASALSSPYHLGTPKEAFALMDPEGKGYITKEALAKFLLSKGRDEYQVEQVWGGYLDNAATDSSGTIDFPSFVKGFYMFKLIDFVRPHNVTAFDELTAFGPGCSIPRTEERGITIRQLRAIYQNIERRCEEENWVDIRNSRLKPRDVVLYDAAKYVIKPATEQRRCSLVELVADGPQKPAWFVSHWWGEPVYDFLCCLERHAADHGLSEDTPYWVCAYANNQHVPSADVTADPSQSSFVKAIELAEGRVLTVIDKGGVTYTRIWCILEIFLGLRGTYEMITLPGVECTAYDMTDYNTIAAAVGADGFRGSDWQAEVYRRLPCRRGLLSVGLTDGSVHCDGGHAVCQTYRQAHFPIDLVQRAFDVDVKNAQATMASDRTHILNYVAGRRGDDLEQQVFESHNSYELTNQRLQGKFAAAAFRLWLEAGQDMDKCCHKIALSQLNKLAISFRDCAALTDETCRLLAANLPSTLEEVRFEVVGSSAGEAGGRALLDGVFERVELSRLRVLEMSDCLLTGAFPEAIGQCVALTELTIAGNRMSGRFPGSIGRCVALREIRIQNNQFCGEVPSSFGNLLQLRLLRMNGNQWEGTLPPSFGQLRQLRELRAQNCARLVGPLPDELALCTELKELAVNATVLGGGVPEGLLQRQNEGTLSINRPRNA